MTIAFPILFATIICFLPVCVPACTSVRASCDSCCTPLKDAFDGCVSYLQECCKRKEVLKPADVSGVEFKELE